MDFKTHFDYKGVEEKPQSPQSPQIPLKHSNSGELQKRKTAFRGISGFIGKLYGLVFII